MNRIAYEREAARENGEPIPSFVVRRRWLGNDHFGPCRGYYERRWIFSPDHGERFIVLSSEFDLIVDDDPSNKTPKNG